MARPESYRFLWTTAKNLHRAQAKSLVAVVLGLVTCGRMRSFDIAQSIKTLFGKTLAAALQRFYRFIRNPKLDDLKVWSPIAHHVLCAAGRIMTISVDWTEWHKDKRVLTAAVGIGRRAIPIFAQTFDKTDIPRSQNSRENSFIKVLGLLSPLVKEAVLLFDRGFRRASLIKLLLQLEHRFVIRLMAKVKVAGASYTGLLLAHPLKPGQTVDLGICRLTSEGQVMVRVVGVWRRGEEEPWWLATSLLTTPRNVAETFDRRVSVEEQFRDTKGCRYGMKMRWTKFDKCERINRLFLIAALALICWTVSGVLATREDPTMRLVSRSKGPRRSFVSIGIEAKWLLMDVLSLGWQAVIRLLPDAEIRHFAWVAKK
jgi:hypothetical protein